ncbi:MAG: hypothetical protein ACLTXS_22920 [[Clostridium] symbiosum]
MKKDELNFSYVRAQRKISGRFPLLCSAALCLRGHYTTPTPKSRWKMFKTL